MIPRLGNMTTMNFDYFEIESFKKDFKSLLKRFRSLIEDIEVVKRDAIELYHLKHINNGSIFPIPGFCFNNLLVCKIKKFSCKSLVGRGCRSGIRVIYAYFPTQNKVEFIQIYYKEREDSDCDYGRIKEYLKSIGKI